MWTDKAIKTSEQIIRVCGKVFYNDRRRRIDIKKPIRDLFEKGISQVSYVMELHLCDIKASERLKQLSEQKVKPVLLYFVSEPEPEKEVESI